MMGKELIEAHVRTPRFCDAFLPGGKLILLLYCTDYQECGRILHPITMTKAVEDTAPDEKVSNETVEHIKTNILGLTMTGNPVRTPSGQP